MTKRLILLAFLSLALIFLLSFMVVEEQETAPAEKIQSEELFLKNNISVYISTEQNVHLINAFALVCIIYCAIAITACKQPVMDANGRVLSCRAYYRCIYEAFLIDERAG